MKIIDWLMSNASPIFFIVCLWLTLCFVVMFTALAIYFVRLVL